MAERVMLGLAAVAECAATGPVLSAVLALLGYSGGVEDCSEESSRS